MRPARAARRARMTGLKIGAAVGAGGECGPFGECECHDCDPALAFRRRVEVNRPSPDAIAGLGLSIDLQSADCAEMALVESPADYLAAMSEHRGQLEPCTGCLDGLSACLLYTSPSPRDLSTSRMPSSA